MQPLLTAKVEDFDQVILALGDRIGDLLPFIGGPIYATALVEILEKLFGAEEISVRNAAIRSARLIISQLDTSLVTQVNNYFEMFKRMSNEEAGESFYMRVSCCSIIADLYKVLDQNARSGLREIYMRLVIDDISMVRRAAAVVFLGVAMEAETEVILDEYLQVIKSLATDEYETVKVIGTENLLPFLKLLKSLNSTASEAAALELLPIIKAAGLDLSWRIRHAISKDFGDFALLFPEEEITNELFPLGVHLIQDNEPDVRTNCLKGMTSFQSVVPATVFINDLMAVALSLVEDPFLTARKLLAEMCIDIAAKVRLFFISFLS